MKSYFFFSILIISMALFSCKKDDDGTGDYEFTALYFTNNADSKLSKVSLASLGSFTNTATISNDHYSCIFFERSTGYVYIGNEPDSGPSSISRVKTDGSGTVEVLFDGTDGVGDPTSIIVNGNKLIWVNSGSNQIMTANKDGSGTVSTMYGGAVVVGFGYGIAISGSKLYWSDFSGSTVTNGIYVGNLDGMGTPVLLYDATVSLTDEMKYPSAIAISGNKIYWSDEDRDLIGYAPLDGSGPMAALYDATDDINSADGLAIDEMNNKIYWSETGDDEIMRANLDGSSASAETVLASKNTFGIALGK
jgi:hypothetical protein